MRSREQSDIKSGMNAKEAAEIDFMAATTLEEIVAILEEHGDILEKDLVYKIDSQKELIGKYANTQDRFYLNYIPNYGGLRQAVHDIVERALEGNERGE